MYKFWNLVQVTLLIIIFVGKLIKMKQSYSSISSELSPLGFGSVFGKHDDF